MEHNFGGAVPQELRVDNPVAATQEQAVRDLEIDPAVFTPADQIRPQARTNDAEVTIYPAQLMGLEEVLRLQALHSTFGYGSSGDVCC